MSFSFAFAGKRQQILEAIEKSIEGSKKYAGNDSTQVERARDIIIREMSFYPEDRTLFVKASGHHAWVQKWDDQAKAYVLKENGEKETYYSGNLSVSVSEFGEFQIL